MVSKKDHRVEKTLEEVVFLVSEISNNLSFNITQLIGTIPALHEIKSSNLSEDLEAFAGKLGRVNELFGENLAPLQAIASHNPENIKKFYNKYFLQKQIRDGKLLKTTESDSASTP